MMKKFCVVLLVLAVTACGDDDSEATFDALVQLQDAAVPDSPIQMFDARPDATPVIFDAPPPDALPALTQGCRVMVSGDTASGVPVWHFDVPESRYNEDFTVWATVQSAYIGRVDDTYTDCGIGEDFPENDAGVIETKNAAGLSFEVMGHLDEQPVPVTFTDQGYMIYQPDPDHVWHSGLAGGSFTFTITSMVKDIVNPSGTYLIDLKGTAHGVLVPANTNTRGTLTMDVIFVSTL